MVSSFKRLAADHSALHDDLPPNYLLPSDDASADDLTQLTALLAGPQGTPYAQGLWRLHLKMPQDYPKSPPKATFRTRIWHPNVEESTGAVCVDTLKRDWKSTLTLKDVLVTISCLLIYPNPDSALNSTAGALLQENYDAFSRQAKLMTSIHALVPSELQHAVSEAKMRGEDAGAAIIPEHEDSRSLRPRSKGRTPTVTMKKRNTRRNTVEEGAPSRSMSTPRPPNSIPETEEQTDVHQDPETDDEPKENDPSLSPSPVKFAPPSPRKHALGKRPLSVLTMPVETDLATTGEDDPDADGTGMSASEKNIAANCSADADGPPQRKSPKLSIIEKGINASGRIREDVKIFEDAPNPGDSGHRRNPSGNGKKSHLSRSGDSAALKERTAVLGPQKPTRKLDTFDSSSSSSTQLGPQTVTKLVVGGSRKPSSAFHNAQKPKPRIGIRRL
ncbi:hypothetical protein P168DRAFT_287065 [Aspergillus campestris IBT 28561]|uniref:UBC core domain-containing protein n=1 Tax=Aspergillus campestris (strain IBT 28561) TaxID=1392248 RepID=A0A2I1DGK0_ASPC2|nr:uncharacterized protein P168DRAFT_287065 [Aspergillus campestris IBT 28561]PKY09003.1 hypothetical protein P168DRAFT_287065 [Aspergillus campestris IBT 28561]